MWCARETISPRRASVEPAIGVMDRLIEVTLGSIEVEDESRASIATGRGATLASRALVFTERGAMIASRALVFRKRGAMITSRTSIFTKRGVVGGRRDTISRRRR